jgi:4'-phosphopantetheinyl transferase
LNDHEVHVWMVHTTEQDGTEEMLAALLSSDERQRASRFKFKKDRRLYIIAHGGLRVLLAGYLRTAPGEIRFVVGAHGKPRLAQADGNAIEFNLSHSHNMALVAFTRGRALGIDLEFSKKNFVFDEIAHRFFTAKEVAAIFELPETMQREAFFRCWTSKEALLKAKSTGLSGQLDEVQITLAGDGSVRIDANVPGWSLAELRPGNGYEAALAVEGGMFAIRRFQWKPALIHSVRGAR